jgi:hypothetical protein
MDDAFASQLLACGDYEKEVVFVLEMNKGPCGFPFA